MLARVVKVSKSGPQGRGASVSILGPGAQNRRVKMNELKKGYYIVSTSTLLGSFVTKLPYTISFPKKKAGLHNKTTTMFDPHQANSRSACVPTAPPALTPGGWAPYIRSACLYSSASPHARGLGTAQQVGVPLRTTTYTIFRGGLCICLRTDASVNHGLTEAYLCPPTLIREN